ncbi:hypothetical protein PR202_ga22889 [Eleusine coracana subsp. coracana]|uniref:Uncharacterized protein n=1 Tax=Eleusine coracana subsp. coracana TaxID=191504 RepID=A0AAV5D3S7_ELECO|nr:hypothetical protein PR202_ga22889 [Eleusine coracana subsp. coracana]
MQVKSGDVRALASTSFLLVRKDQTSEIRLHGFKMLQHLVRLRWDELSATERNEFANLTISLISDVVGPNEVWALKSQTAALVAEVVRREGVALLNTLLPSIVSLSNSGPIEAELVAMILRWLPEDITVHNEDLEGDRRRSLLRGLTESLPQILPLLYSVRFPWRLHYVQGLILKRPVDVAVAEYDAAMSNIFQMLEYYQHYKIMLHFQSLLFWLAVLREPSKAKSIARVSGDNSTAGISASTGDSSVEKEKKGVSVFITDELDLIKVIASQRPVIAAASIVQRINVVFGDTNQATKSPQNLDALEGAQLGLEAVYTEFPTASQPGILQQLLSLKWAEPNLAVIHGHYLDALGPFLRHYPDAVAGVVSKLFELLTSLPITFQDSSNDSRLARLQICSSFIRISRAADKALLPHMKNIADTMAYLQGEGRLLRGEHNHLCEAFLVMASSAGMQQQQEVLAWLLEPLNKMWTQVDWQTAYLSDPSGLTRMFADTQFMWSIYHTVTFFEKALKRSGIKKSTATPQVSTTTTWYNVLGLAATLGEPFFRSIECSSVTVALMENVQPLFVHCQQALNYSWSSLLHEGRAKVPDSIGNLSGSELKVEVMEEKLLRDLTREVCSVLWALASPALNSGLPSLEQLGPSNRMDSSLRDLESFASSSLTGFLLLHGGSALPALRISVEVFTWTDSEAVTKVIPFCGALIHLAVATNQAELRQFVAKDLFSSIIHGLSVESNSIMSAELVGLCREIYVYLSDKDPAPRQLRFQSMEAAADKLAEIAVQLADLARQFKLLADLEKKATKEMVAEALHKHNDEVVAGILAFTGYHQNEDDDQQLPDALPPSCKADLLCRQECRQQDSTMPGRCSDAWLLVEPSPPVEAATWLRMQGPHAWSSCRGRHQAVVLLSLPHIKQEDLLAFDDSLRKTASPKEQKQHMRSLLLLATGNKLRALAAQKATNVITNVTSEQTDSSFFSFISVQYRTAVLSRNRGTATHHRSSAEEDGHIGLAALSST